MDGYDLNILINFTKNIFTSSFIKNDFYFFIKNYGLVFLIATLLSMPISKIIKDKIINSKWKGVYCTIFFISYLILFIITISFLVSDTYNPFLYFRF